MLHILIALVLFSACRKDKTEFILSDNIVFDLSTCDTNGVEMSEFVLGANVGFTISMRNITDKTFYYFEGLKCASIKFEVFQEDLLYGVPHASNSMCTDILTLEKIVGAETLKSTVFWLDNPDNSALNTGNYRAVFTSKIAFNDSDEIVVGKSLNWIPIIVESNFKVQ